MAGYCSDSVTEKEDRWVNAVVRGSSTLAASTTAVAG